MRKGVQATYILLIGIVIAFLLYFFLPSLNLPFAVSGVASTIYRPVLGSYCCEATSTTNTLNLDMSGSDSIEDIYTGSGEGTIKALFFGQSADDWGCGWGERPFYKLFKN